MEENKTHANKTNKELVFIKDVAKYFMDFLETDFHKRRSPKRRVQLRTPDNLLVGVDAAKYPKFFSILAKDLTKILQNGFTIRKGVYGTQIPKNLLDLVNLRVGKIKSKDLKSLLADIDEEFLRLTTLYKDEPDKAITETIDAVASLMGKSIVTPLIQSLEKSIENLSLGDENTVFLIEEELTEVLAAVFSDKIVELVNRVIADEKPNVKKELSALLELEDLQGRILSFFDNFKVIDLYSELFELERNRKILDKQEFYLYLCDITYQKIKYPIFYIPFTIRKDQDSFMIDFDSQLYVNKKALTYIVQEYNAENKTKGTLKLAQERIIYLAQDLEGLESLMNDLLAEISGFFQCDKTVSIGSSTTEAARSLFARISNGASIALFDKSDEALVNDYEEILQLLSEEDSILGAGFEKLLEGFIHKEPQSFNKQVRDEWDDSDVPERLVFASPIPLNGEQRQILSALQKDGCRYITVEGPPGTGKSHTITAVVFDAILKNQSVLVLSDKKEALDVVEDKITDTLRAVRADDRFQNPILRLGKTGGNYSKILASSSISDIENHYRAVKNDYTRIEENVSNLLSQLSANVEGEVDGFSSVELSEIQEVIALEEYLNSIKLPVELERVSFVEDADILLVDFKEAVLFVTNLIDKNNSYALSLININQPFESFVHQLQMLKAVFQSAQAVAVDDGGLQGLKSLPGITPSNLEKLDDLCQRYHDEKHWLTGFVFKKKSLQAFDQELRAILPESDYSIMEQGVSNIEHTLQLYGQLGNQLDLTPEMYEVVRQIIISPHEVEQLQALVDAIPHLAKLEEIISTLTSGGVLSETKTVTELLNQNLVAMKEDVFNRLIRYLHLNQKVKQQFADIPGVRYAETMKDIQGLVTAKMTFLMDGRVIDFYENNKATAKALRDIIRSKRRFPREQFLKLKEAFPCILAGIRDYAEYIPLEPEMFDLVIIDEASQVSIAQALPALLRAKRVLILGDRKQFSNIKAAQARSETNREYLNVIAESFKRHVSKETDKLVRLEKFNIKTSILEFFEFVTNYHTQLMKHFRGYREIIGYSNKYFYSDSLQVMKIRGKSLDQVLQFSFVDTEGKQDLIHNTNTKEIEFITEKLKEIKESGVVQTVGIITPHTNQQKLLVEKIGCLPEADYFFDTLKLKIMTFDTCQGEERDVIFYSMVASPESDRLWGIFIKDLSQVDLEEGGMIKAQRLNVGFSRAKETMHFVLSKPIDAFSGSIGEALRHYQYVLEEGAKEREVSEVDGRSKMEPHVLNWFYQTKFWNDNKDSIEFIPQFEIGKYLQQLDKRYDHPLYKVDFLLLYKDPKGSQYKIIIEYDGFNEHFTNTELVNEFNYENYYKDEDVYRQKVLEGYGYTFLRINRFNAGSNPVESLDERIRQITGGAPNGSNLITKIQETVGGLTNGDMKECSRCGEIKSLQDYKDSTLISGIGRVCRNCKGMGKRSRAKQTVKSSVEVADKACPRCGSNMVKRSGRYGSFYGCSKFPYCKGTRKA